MFETITDTKKLHEKLQLLLSRPRRTVSVWGSMVPECDRHSEAAATIVSATRWGMTLGFPPSSPAFVILVGTNIQVGISSHFSWYTAHHIRWGKEHFTKKGPVCSGSTELSFLAPFKGLFVLCLWLLQSPHISMPLLLGCQHLVITILTLEVQHLKQFLFLCINGIFALRSFYI